MGAYNSGDSGPQPAPSAANAGTAFDQEVLRLTQLLAARYYRHGMPREAAQLYAFIIRHDPTEPLHYLGLGKAHHAQGQYEQALNAYQRAVALGWHQAAIHLFIAQCQIFLDQMGPAEQALQACLQLASLPLSGQAESDDVGARAGQLLSRVLEHRKRAAGIPQTVPGVVSADPAAVAAFSTTRQPRVSV